MKAIVTTLAIIGGVAALSGGYYYAETKDKVPAFFTKMFKKKTETPPAPPVGGVVPSVKPHLTPAQVINQASTPVGGASANMDASVTSVNWANI